METELNAFTVTVSGEVERGVFPGSTSSVTVSYSFVARADTGWVCIGGETRNISPMSYSSSDVYVWNIPLSCTYSAVTPVGWPRLLITVYSTDWLGRDIILGYGLTLIPSQPGRYERRIPLFTPTSSSWWSSLSGWLLGRRPVLIDAEAFFLEQEHVKPSVSFRSLGGAAIFTNLTIDIQADPSLELKFC
jgi:hypothetical protein